MKKIVLSIVIVFFLSSVLLSDDEKYSFIYFNGKTPEMGKEFKWQTYRELSFKIPSIGHIQFASSFKTIEEYMGKEGEFYIIKSTLTDMEKEDYVEGIQIMDYYWESMENIPCYVYLDLDNANNVHHIKPVEAKNSFLQEAFEGIYMGLFEREYYYPFSSKAIDVKEGDSWTSIADSFNFFMTIDSPRSHGRAKWVFTLKKVKEKKGRKIAYIEIVQEVETEMNINVNFDGKKRFLTGTASGIIESKIQWDLEAGMALYIRTGGNLQGDFEMDDETFTTRFNRFETVKLNKKSFFNK